MTEQNDHIEAAATDGPARCPCCGNEMDEVQRHAAYLWFRKRRRGLALAAVMLVGIHFILWFATGDPVLFSMFLGASQGIIWSVLVFVPKQGWRRSAHHQPPMRSDESRGDEAVSHPPT